MIKLITDEKNKQEWNEAVRHPLQTWEWGEVKKKAGNKVLRVAEVDEAGHILRAITVTLHQLPLGKCLAYAPRSFWPSSEFLPFIKTHIGDSCIAFKLEPDLWAQQAGDYSIPLLKKNWEQNGFRFVVSNSTVMAAHTFVIDLSVSEDTLLSNMKSKTRYNMRLAQKKGVTVQDETQNPAAFGIFYDLYVQTIKRQNYLGHSREYHENVWRTMSAAHLSRIFVAYFEGAPLAAYQLFFFNKSAYYLYGGTSTSHKEVMAPTLLMWWALRAAKERGCAVFDMWGALPQQYDPRSPWAGFHRFKEGFGAEHKTYMPTIDVIYKPFEYALFSSLWSVRNNVLELKQKLFA